MEQFDLFADALWQFFVAGYADLVTEREDGYAREEDVSWYFTTARDFPKHEQQALKFARGKVLDIGCGAGRHSLYLQKRGLAVTAIDVAPELVQLAQARGVKDARVADACKRLPFRAGEFGTALLFGNNLGIAGTPQKLRRMLRELHRVTATRGRILATTRMPSTTNPQHLSYLRQNIQRGRAAGQLRLRLALNGRRGAWFDLLLLAPTDLLVLAAQEQWKLTQVFPLESFEAGYGVVLEKK